MKKTRASALHVQRCYFYQLLDGLNYLISPKELNGISTTHTCFFFCFVCWPPCVPVEASCFPLDAPTIFYFNLFMTPLPLAYDLYFSFDCWLRVEGPQLYAIGSQMDFRHIYTCINKSKIKSSMYNSLKTIYKNTSEHKKNPRKVRSFTTRG